MIGIIFQPNKLYRIVKKTESLENVQFYYDLAQINKVNLLFYSTQGFSWRKRVSGYLYDFQTKQLVYKKADIPKVNILRTNVKSKRAYYQLKKIEQDQNIRFINIHSGRNKFGLHQFLKENERINDHLPHTERLTYDHLLRFLRDYHKVIIKPINGALGQKISTIEKKQDGYVIHYSTYKKHHEKHVKPKQLHYYYKRLFVKPSRFIIQKWIPFKTYQGRKFDIRTSVQKGKDDQWRVTGIVTRVAAEGGIVTNVAKGGRVVPFNEVNCTLDPETEGNMYKLSLEIAKELEKRYPSLIDLGLDIGLDEQGKLWFIEANYCDQRYAYREAKDFEMWEASYRTPFEYAYAVYQKI